MAKKILDTREGRMIHIRLPQEVHKRLRIHAAEMDTTIQDWVAAAVITELKRQEEEISGQAGSKQVDERS
jgi:plasmid stability protein